MREAAIIGTARTPVGKANRGAFRETEAPVLAAHAVRQAIDRSGIDIGRIDEVLLGVGNQWGTQSYNPGRLAVHAAGLPDRISGASVDRKCGSGLTTLAYVARAIMTDEIDAAVSGGVESISLTVGHGSTHRHRSDAVIRQVPTAYMPMIETAEVVAERYGISREAQDEYAAESHRRAAAAVAAGRLDAEIAPISISRELAGECAAGLETVRVERDEGIRADTTVERLSQLKTVWSDGQWVKEGRYVTAGNASQLSDGASAQVLMERKTAEAAGHDVLAIFRGFQVAGCAPDEMGIGPVFAIPKLLSRAGLRIGDVDMWEINEAFASQLIYCRDALGIDPDKLNVSGGAIAIGHPFGMTGSRLVGHIVTEGRRRGAKYAVASMCVAGGMGAAGLFELC